MTKLFPYQKETVLRAHRLGGRALLALEMGLGKSLTAMTYAQRYGLLPCVVVCPASVKWTWEDQIKRHLGMRATVLEGSKAKPWTVRPAPFVVINYDILGGWLAYLKGLDPRLIVLDESHFLAGRSTLRTKRSRDLCHGVGHVLALSGTPLVNRPAELWPTLNILRPKQYKSFWTFARQFCALRRTPWGWDVRGASRLPKLHAQLEDPKRGVMIRFRKEDVLDQLPPKQRSVITLPLSKPAEYREAVEDFIGWLRRTMPHKERRAAKAEQLVRFGYLKRLIARLKFRAVCGWVDDFLSGNDGKLILFCVHRKLVSKLHERYGAASVVVDGSVTGRKRQAAFDQFLGGRRTRILIGNIRAAGVGWSGKGIGSVAFTELDWTPGAHRQAEDRIHGIGRGVQGICPDVYYLLGRGTLEEELFRLLVRKQKVSDAILDGGRPSDFDVVDRLARKLLEGEK